MSSEERPLPDEAAPVIRAGYLAVLRRNPSYRSLWLGDVVSLFGDWFNLIASASLISELTGSGMAVGGLFVVRMLAPFLVSPLAGVAADRYNRKSLLILADLARAAVVLGFLVVRDPGDIWLLYVLNAVQLGISGFFFPARNAILPDIVQRSELGAANALSSATWSVMLALGSAIGGLVAGGWGIYPAFVIDSATFLLSAVFISQVRYPRQVEVEGGRTVQAVVGQYLDGLAYLKRYPDVLAVSLHKPAFSLLSNGVFQVVQVILAQQFFVIGEGGGTSLGLMYAVAGLGTGLGPLVARHFTGDRERPLRKALVIAYLIGSLGLAVTAPLLSLPLVLFGTFLRAFGGGINWVFSTQLLLQNVSDRVRGRIFSTEFALFTLTNAASTAVGGVLIDRPGLSLSAILWGLAFLLLIPAGLWALWIARNPAREAAES